MTPAELRTTLDKLGLTQAGLARILGITPQAVSRWVQEPGAPSHAPIPTWAVRVLQWMQEPGRPPEWPQGD